MANKNNIKKGYQQIGWIVKDKTANGLRKMARTDNRGTAGRCVDFLYDFYMKAIKQKPKVNTLTLLPPEPMPFDIVRDMGEADIEAIKK